MCFKMKFSVDIDEVGDVVVVLAVVVVVEVVEVSVSEVAKLPFEH